MGQIFSEEDWKNLRKSPFSSYTFTGCNLFSGKFDAFFNHETIENLPIITDLNLSCNDLGSREIKVLTSAFKNHLNLRSLNLRNNDLKCNEMAQIALAVKHFSNLTSLDLKFNSFGPKGAKYMLLAAELEMEYLPNLTSLDLGLGFNNLESEGIKHVALLLDYIPNIRILNLVCNKIESNEEEYIKSLFKHIYNVKI